MTAKNLTAQPEVNNLEATAAGIHLAAGSNQDQGIHLEAATAAGSVQEIRVYGINPDRSPDHLNILGLNDAEFQDEAERQGLVWSLPGFQEQFNQDDLTSASLFIRFITIK